MAVGLLALAAVIALVVTVPVGVALAVPGMKLRYAVPLAIAGLLVLVYGASYSPPLSILGGLVVSLGGTVAGYWWHTSGTGTAGGR